MVYAAMLNCKSFQLQLVSLHFSVDYIHVQVIDRAKLTIVLSHVFEKMGEGVNLVLVQKNRCYCILSRRTFCKGTNLSVLFCCS